MLGSQSRVCLVRSSHFDLGSVTWDWKWLIPFLEGSWEDGMPFFLLVVCAELTSLSTEFEALLQRTVRKMTVYD